MATIFDPPASDLDYEEHERTYRKFVTRAQIAALCTPLFMAFLLYWTT
jgi:aa3 type cytochrome c oxidase subunit IV